MMCVSLKQILCSRNNIFVCRWLHKSLTFVQSEVQYPPKKYDHFSKQYLVAIPDEARLTVPELIHKYGYPVEEHDVVTNDGYVLTMHRIPHGRYPSSDFGRPAVLIVHGFISNSADTVIAGPDNALSFYLADAGYDVWIGNTRGNRYSRKHLTLDTASGAYWDFSWTTIGMNDVPAMVDHIILTTHQKHIFYIGHSRGSTLAYIMCSEKPEYNKKLRAIISLAPIAYMSHIPGPVYRTYANILTSIQLLFKLSGTYQITPNRDAIAQFGQMFCSDGVQTQAYCASIFFILAGFDTQFNTTLLPTILGHLPDAFSIKEAIHYGQLINSGNFQDFDYGLLKNIFIYGNIAPPVFKLSSVTVPVAIFYSNNDWQTSPIDIDRLYRELFNPIGKFLVKTEPNHFSFLFGRNITGSLYDKILSIMHIY